MLSKTNENNICKCNCRSKPNCPLNGECFSQCLIYKGKHITSNNSFVYYGTSEWKFKTRYNKHTKLFRRHECINETELSKHVWFYQNMIMVLRTICHGKSAKRPHHTNVVQNVAIYVCQKKLPSFVLIQTPY